MFSFFKRFKKTQEPDPAESQSADAQQTDEPSEAPALEAPPAADVPQAPVQPAAAPAPAPVRPAAAPASASLDAVLEQAGLVWVNTDADKFRAAQEAASRLPRPARVPRERKAQPPVDPTPMQQVETHR